MMDWRALFQYDLRQWLPGYHALPKPVGEEKPDKVFEDYPRSVRNKIIDPMWRGPQCLQPHVEVLYFLEQIRLCTRAGLPLHQGLDAAARNEFQTLRAGLPGFQLRLSAGLLLAVVVAAAVAVGLAFGAVVFSAAVPFTFMIGAMTGMGIADAALRRSRRAAVCGSLVRSMSRGLTLSESMARLDKLFPRAVVSMVEVGEATGRLAGTVEQLNRDALRRFYRGRQNAGWLAYIGSVLLIQVLVIGFLVYKVVPVMIEVVRELHADPSGMNARPGETIIPFPLPSIELLGDPPPWLYGGFAFVLALAAILFFSHVVRQWPQPSSGKRRFRADLDIHIPVYRQILALQNPGAAAIMLARLLNAGVPLDRALSSTAGSGLHPAYAVWLENVCEKVRAGESLSDAFALAPATAPVPPAFHEAVAMGEQLGRLEAALDYIGERFADSAETRMQWISGWAQVGSILILAYFVLAIEVGVLGTLVDIVHALIV